MTHNLGNKQKDAGGYWPEKTLFISKEQDDTALLSYTKGWFDFIEISNEIYIQHRDSGKYLGTNGIDNLLRFVSDKSEWTQFVYLRHSRQANEILFQKDKSGFNQNGDLIYIGNQDKRAEIHFYRGNETSGHDF